MIKDNHNNEFILHIAFKNCRKVQDVIRRPRECSGNPHSLDCFVAIATLRNDARLFFL